MPQDTTSSPALDAYAIETARPPERQVAEALLETDLPEPADDYRLSPDELEALALEIYPGTAELREKLLAMYSHVSIHLREPPPSCWENERIWIVTCRRDQAMPYPPGFAAHNGGSRFRNLVISWLEDWARSVNLYIYHIETYGSLRKNVTFKFNTRRPGAKFRFSWSGPGAQQESAVPPDAEAGAEELINDLVLSIDWENDLQQCLWAMRSTGVSYHVQGRLVGGIVLVTAQTYFEPHAADFASRMFDAVLAFMRRRKLPLLSARLWSWSDTVRGNDYPRWTVYVGVNLPDNIRLDIPPEREWKAEEDHSGP